MNCQMQFDRKIRVLLQYDTPNQQYTYNAYVYVYPFFKKIK